MADLVAGVERSGAPHGVASSFEKFAPFTFACGVTFVAARYQGMGYSGGRIGRGRDAWALHVVSQEPKHSMDPLPSIDRKKCTGCHRCVDICPTQALAQAAGKAYLAHPERCTYCTVCEDVCPEDAIALPFLIVLAPQYLPDLQGFLKP